ncbi:MAG TPA: hypothetical protein VMK16_01465, partial [Acidimicrobiales bacterium]|nr:hypothetical protein [Acidimicrobiales bacterium]
NAEFWVFHLATDSVVTVTATNYKPTSTSNSAPILDTVLNPAFSVYAGTLVPLGHDDVAVDPLQPVDPDTLDPLPSLTDAGPPGWVYSPHDGYRDTVNNSYFGQFDAFANWSMANASGNWSQVSYVSSVSTTPCSGASCGTTTTAGYANAGHVAGNNGSSETLTLTLAAGDYTIAVGGESGNSANGAGALPCTNVNGATGTSGACTGARLYATVTVAISAVATTTTSSTTTSSSTSTTSSTSTSTSTSSTSSTTSTSAPPATSSTTTSTTPTTVATTSTSTSTTLAPFTDAPVSGKTLILKTRAGVPARSGLTMTSKDVTITLGAGNGSGDDPTTAGATVRVRSAAGGFDDTYVLPASKWLLVGKAGQNKGYKYKDAALQAGPVSAALVKPGKTLKVTGRGAGLGHALGVDPVPVEVTVTLGGHRYCLAFGGTSTWKADKLFKATNAPAPASCAP